MLPKQSLLVGSLTVILIFSYIITGNILAEKGNSALLSLEPSTITIPFLDSRQGCTLLILKLKIYNVTNLKIFSLKLDYNTSILEFIGSKMDRIFYITVGGWRGEYTSGELHKAFSGSGTMFIYYFKVLSFGSTQIRLKDTSLLDNSGSNISHVTSGATIKIRPYNEWMNEKYNELKLKYNMLLINYNKILTKYKALNSTYEALLLNYNELNGKHNKLKSKYNVLLINYTEILAKYKALNPTYKALLFNYNELNKKYNELKSKHNILLINYKEILTKYQVLNSTYKALLFNYNELNNTYHKLLLYSHSINQSYNLLKHHYNLLNSSFTLLKRNYDSLQKNYKNLQLNYRELELQFKTIINLFTITKYIIYCFAITIIILIIVSIYFIKKIHR